MSTVEVKVTGACPHDCPDTCVLQTTVRDGVAIRVAGHPGHAHTDGVLCTKVSRYPERIYHAERVLYPLRRCGPKGSGRFERVSWDEALRDIASRLQDLARVDPQSILPYSYAGTMGLVQGDSLSARFFHRLGASRLDRTICASAGAEALDMTLGTRQGMRLEQFAHARLIVIWGSNPITSHLHFWRYALAARRAGARLVCIDPRRSETADHCDEHLALWPGSDAALAYALVHEWVVHDWLDHDYIDRYTLGWSPLRERALEWPPERAADVCGVPAERIRALARDMGLTARAGQPVAIRLNYGMQRVPGGGHAVRLIASLPALLGAWRQAAGGCLLSSSGAYPVQRDRLQRPDLLSHSTCPSPRHINMSAIGDALLHPGSADFGPPVRALVVYNSNPVAVAPDSARVAAGFAREDLFTVVLEHFMTDTADHADYVLPATMQLEHWDIHASYGHTDVVLNRPAIAPPAECRPNTAVFRALAQRMGFTDPCFEDDDLSLCRQAFGEAIDFQVLLDQGFAGLDVPQAPFATGGFPTPSGRCELFSQRLADRGIDGLPAVRLNLERPGQDERYPLAMISPPARHFLNSTFANLASLQRTVGEPRLEIHPQDAIERGIVDGMPVRVFNDRGVYECVAQVSERARPGVVVGLGIWWRKQGRAGTNVNQLTSQRLTDIGQAPTFYDCAVQVQSLG